MKSDINLNQIGPAFSHFFHRYHVIIFVVLAVGGLATATMLLSQTLATESVAETTPASTKFDQKTIDKLKTLRGKDDQNTRPTLPAGRINPF